MMKQLKSTLDAIIISDIGKDSFSGSNPLKLKIQNKIADIQVIKNYLDNKGQILFPIKDDGLFSWNETPRLNGIYLYSFLSSNKINVELINSYDQQKQRFLDLLKNNPKCIIISTTFIINKNELKKLVDDIRSVAHDILIIAGGPLIYKSYCLLELSKQSNYEIEHAKKDYLFLNVQDEPQIDLYITSPKGEDILYNVITRFINGQNYNDLPDLAWLSDDRFVFTKHQKNTLNKKIHNIDWSIMPDKLFNKGIISMQASKGCIYNCAFCNFCQNKRLIRIKPIKQIFKEIHDVVNRGIKYIWFVDDTFRAGKNDLNAFCKMLIKEKLSVKWMSFNRADSLKQVDFDLLKEAGCIELQIGIESGDKQILKNMNKQVTPEDYYKIISNLLKTGINCSCYFIIGFPGETEASVEKTLHFIENIHNNNNEGTLSWSIYPFLLSPLSPIFSNEMRKQYNLTGYMGNWKHRTMNSNQAKQLIKEMFLKIEDSGPIYRGDNLNLLSDLPAIHRKKFMINRHRLNKKCINQEPGYEEVKYFFKKILITK